MTRRGWVSALGLWALILPAASLAQDDFEREPIRYSQQQPDNPVSRLQQRVDRGEVALEYEEGTGYLRSVLSALDIATDTQTLVFSKTSLQRHRIAPRTPRAIYFNDDLYVGYCQRGDVMEVSVADPRLGTVFYTLDQERVERPQFVRQTDNCLICHGSSQTRGIPGHLLRSVFVDRGGLPILSSGSYRVDQTTPIEHRWGGWYVTGRHGGQEHLGNLVIDGRSVPQPLDNSAGQNLTDLSERFDVSRYPTPHSDLIALMVLEHQAMAHNLIVRANFETRHALHYEATLNRELKEPADNQWESARSRIRHAAEELADYLLFAEEAPLREPIAGTSGFAVRFSSEGPRDAEGRSLRDLDLQTRLFRYPCSYLVYSDAFEALPDEVRELVWRRIWDVLQRDEPDERFPHLNASTRQQIVAILRSTHPRLPNYWR